MSDKNQARILVVDDEVDLLEIAKDWLSDYNCIVEVASTVKDAWAALTKNPFAMVVSDLNLGPGGSGTKIYELTQKNLLNPPEFIFTSGSSAQYSDFFSKNQVKVVEKPNTWARISKQIEQALVSSNNHQASRRFVRFKNHMNTACLTVNNNIDFSINVLNYSRGGVLANLQDNVLNDNDFVKLEILLNDKNSVASYSKVKWVKADPMTTRSYMVGIEFVHFVQGDDTWIEGAVQNI